MKIGIFLGYGPQTILGKEGLGRYLGTLIKGFQENGQDVLISCPHWLIQSLDDLFDDFYIQKDEIQWIVTRDDPIIWRAYQKYVLGTGVGRFFKYLSLAWSRIKKCVVFILNEFVAMNYLSEFIFAILTLLFIFMLLTPFWVVIIIVGVLCYGLLRLGRRLRLCCSNIFRKYVGDVYFFKKIQARYFRKMEEEEQKRLIRAINKNRDQMDIWFIPSLFWPVANEIKSGTVVINAPDLIPEEFPVAFGSGGELVDSAVRKIRQTLAYGERFITYNEYIRKELLLAQYHKHADYVVAINHANNDLMPYLWINPNVTKQNHANKNHVEAYAKSFLNEYANVRYVFYSSQARPNKNILNLIKAFEYLLRKRFMNIKLFLTASLGKYEPVGDYVREHRLERDVISFYNVPARNLAALYYCADLVVNPTLYEGGFPFTFGEGMSVGTPSIMSDIPQTREVLEPAGLEEILFDPYDWKAMAEKIEYALAHKEELYQKELPLYQEMAQRTPEIEAKDYIKAFEYFMQSE